MSHLRRAVSALLLLSGLVVLSPAAEAAGSGSVAAAGGVIYSDCRDHAYMYDLQLPSDTESWDLEVSVLGPDGLEHTSDYVYDDGWYTGAGVSSFQVCGGAMPGRYTLQAVLTTYDYDYNPSAELLPTASFDMRLPFTRTKLTVSNRTPRFNQVVTFKVKTKDERVNGYYATEYPDVRLEVRRDGQWRKVKGSKTMANGVGVAKIKYRWNVRSAVKVRAVTIGDDYYAASVSSAVTVK